MLFTVISANNEVLGIVGNSKVLFIFCYQFSVLNVAAYGTIKLFVEPINECWLSLCSLIGNLVK